VTDEELRALADQVWEQIMSAIHWGDGRMDAFNNLLDALKKARDGGRSGDRR
jgi:hypothetical protein